jgi:hypothetical protein
MTILIISVAILLMANLLILAIMRGAKEADSIIEDATKNRLK